MLDDRQENMITLFNVLALVGMGLGFGIGMSVGAKHFGVGGGVIGAILGGCSGLIIGRIPGILVLRSIARDLMSMSSDELRAYLHGPRCPTPNFVLLELKSRGEDIRRELTVVVELLRSEDVDRRGRGWAALTS